MKTAHLSVPPFIILTVAMLLFCMPNFLLADDHGDDFSQATFISVGASISGSINPSEDIDYFEFTVSQTATYVMYTRSITNTWGELYDANYSRIESDCCGGEDDNFRIVRSLTPGTYYVMVRGELSHSTGNYELHLEGPGAGTVSDDHGFSPWSASAVTVGNITDGSIDIPDDRDYFEFTVSQTATYVMYARGITNTWGELYDANYSRIESDCCGGEDDNFRIVRSLTPGTYYVMVRGELSHSTGNYELHLEGPGAGTVSDDHGFSPWSASAVTVGNITDGSIDIPDDRDYFEFTVSQTATYVMYTRSITNTWGELYDANYSRIESDCCGGEDDNFRIVRSLTPGTYYVMVRGELSHSTGNYELHLEGPGAGTVSDDHGFSPWSASAVTVGSITDGSIDIPDDRDYFEFTVSQTATYVMYTRSITNTWGELYDANYSRIESDCCGGEDDNFRIVRSLTPGTYYVMVRGELSHSTGNYELHLEGPGGVSLSVSLTPNPSSGDTPLDITLTADISGTATGTINYTFWWNCDNPGTSVEEVASVCGNPNDQAIGAKFDGVWDDPKTVTHKYWDSGTYTAKVIAERGSAFPVEKRVTITVGVEKPDLTISVALPKATFNPNERVEVPVTVYRSGGDLTQGTYVTGRLYWSQDSHWDEGIDKQLWESNGSKPDYPNSYLNTHSSKEVIPAINIPDASGYIIAVVDPTNYHEESNENNNEISQLLLLSPLSGHLDHFLFSTISSPQTVGTPFQVTISARDAGGGLISSFNGSVALGASAGQVYPPEIDVSNGVGTIDKVKLYSAGTGMYLTAQGHGMYGKSDSFDVTGQGAMTGNLTGVVRDGGGKRLTGAAVWLSRTKDGWDYQIYTTNGNYNFTDIPCGSYYVWAEYDGARSHYHPVKVPCSNQTAVENITVVKCNPQAKTPVLLVPGIMGSTSKYKDGGGYPVLPEDPPAWNSGRLVLLDPAGRAGWTDLIKDKFKANGYQLGCNLFQVPYDWRMDINQAWKQYLKKWIDEAKRITDSPKVNIVAHSMGGLLTRAYIQSEDYDDDIDRFAMVGTPNYGAATAYYLWEGGDPRLADELNESWLDDLLLINFYTNTINNMYKTFHSNNPVCRNLRGLGFYCDRDKIFDLITEHGESVHQLMPTYDDPLSTGAITDPDSINTFLIDLNNSPNISKMVHDNSQDPDKVTTCIFGGTAKNTIETVNVGKSPGNKFYPDGEPKGKPSYDNLGDGTVLTKSLQGPFALIPNFEAGSHSGLIKKFAGDIFEFITGSQPCQKFMAAAQPASLLAVQINGRASGYVQSPGGLESGIKEGALVEEIPGTEVLFSPDAGYIKIENPSEGAYTVILNSPHQEDFGIELMYGNDQDIINRQMIVFSHGAPFTFSFTLHTASDERITIQHTPETPIDLKADAVDQGGLKTRLSWNISSGASSYRIYAKNQGEPYLKLLGTTSSLSFNTGDEWAYDASITTRFYAVSAVNVQDAESFLSDMVKNDDRDHDGLTDVQEAAAGSNPDNPDSDGDGLLDVDEHNRGTNPLVKDTDGDGYSDYKEIQAGSDPLDENSVPSSEGQDPPTRIKVGICDAACQATAPVIENGGVVEVNFNYNSNVNIMVGLLSSDFSQIWWLNDSCKFTTDYTQALSNAQTLTCSVSMPSGAENGWLFWLVTEENFSSLDWENGIYELLFYECQNKLNCDSEPLSLCGSENACLAADDFEGYQVGKFPSEKWELIKNWDGTSCQYVTDEKAVSGTKSLKLEANWPATTVHELPSTPDIIYFEVDVMTKKIVGDVIDGAARVSLYNPDIGTLGGECYYAGVDFSHNGKIKLLAGGGLSWKYVELQEWEPEQWYKIKVKYNSRNVTADVWINDVLKAFNVVLDTADTRRPGNYTTISLTGHSPSWFDNVKVYKPIQICGFNDPPIIDLFAANFTDLDAEEAVTFICTAHDPNGTIASYKWDFDGDGNVDQITSDGTVVHFYNTAGTYQARVTAMDNDGARSVSDPTITIIVNG